MEELRRKAIKQNRHQWNWQEIYALYNSLCSFLEDCEREEVEEYRDSILHVKQLLHDRMKAS